MQLWCIESTTCNVNDSALQVDVYSFAMIMFQLFEHTPPFAGVDPVEAARAAALDNRRPKLEKLASKQDPMPVSPSKEQYLTPFPFPSQISSGQKQSPYLRF